MSSSETFIAPTKEAARSLRRAGIEPVEIIKPGKSSEASHGTPRSDGDVRISVLFAPLDARATAAIDAFVSNTGLEVGRSAGRSVDSGGRTISQSLSPTSSATASPGANGLGSLTTGTGGNSLS